MIYTLTLNPALDYDIYLDKFVQEELNSAKETNIRAGGKGINVSKALNSLGDNSIAMGFTAGFTGEIIKKELHKDNIKTKFIDVNGLTRINVKVSVDYSKETEIAGTSPSFTKEHVNELLETLNNLTSEDILVLSGSIPKGLDNDIYKNIVDSISSNPKIVLDTRGDLILQNLSKNKDKKYVLVKPNILELEQMFNEKLNTDEDVIKKAKFFIDYGVENVLVSKGSKGAILITKDWVYSSEVPKGKLINSIGAGDSMVAGFVSGLVKGNIENAFRLSVACGSATAYSHNIATHKEIMELYNHVEVVKKAKE